MSKQQKRNPNSPSAKAAPKTPAKAAPQAAKPASGNFLQTAILLAIVLILTYFVFSPSMKCDFTNWDDPTYVTKNDLVTKPYKTTTKDVFKENISSNYHPLTILSLRLDYAAVKLEPKRYHAVNVLFHLLNTLLVFVFAFLLSKRKMMVAAITAVLFGIHPLHVESVTWVSERKDVLYVFFFMLALISYHYYSIGKWKAINYILMLAFFLLSCLSKAMAVVLPLVMLLLDYFEGRNFKNKWLWIEKVPFFIVALIFGMIAVKTQQDDAIAKFETFTLMQRVMFGTYGMMNYVLLFIFPNKLSAFYPYPFLENNHLPYIFYAAPIIAAAIFFVAYRLIKVSKIYWFGLLFFFATILLVLQFMSVGKAIMADRYAYLSYLGFSLIVGFEYDRIVHSTNKVLKSLRVIVLPLLLVFIGVLSYITYYRTMIWTNNYTLWSDVIKKYPYVDVSYKNRGNHYVDEAMLLRDKGPQYAEMVQKIYDAAMADYMNYIVINKGDPKIYTNRGNIYGIKGKYDLALEDYSRSIQLDSVTNLEAFLNRGITHSMMRKYKEAIDDYKKAELIDPTSIGIYQNRGYVYMDMGNYAMAVEDYTKYINEMKDDFNPFFYRGLCYFKMGKFKEAVDDNTIAISLKPDNAGCYQNRSLAYKELKMYSKSLEDALKAKSMGVNIDDRYIEELRGLTKSNVK